MLEHHLRFTACQVKYRSDEPVLILMRGVICIAGHLCSILSIHYPLLIAFHAVCGELVKARLVVQRLIEERISLIERTEARGRLRESEKRLSQNIYERGVDDAGFGRIRSKGDCALFGGYTTQEMKNRLGVKDNRPLADFLPTLSIAAKNLATEMTNYNVEEKDLLGERAITVEHIQNNLSVREMLGKRGIRPEKLPPAEDIKKLERRVKSQEKKIAAQSGRLPNLSEDGENDNGK